MAGIDKIYGTTEQWDEFHTWMKQNKPDALWGFYPRNGYEDNNDRPITNFSQEVDRWLWKNCPIDWVLTRLSEQYTDWMVPYLGMEPLEEK